MISPAEPLCTCAVAANFGFVPHPPKEIRVNLRPSARAMDLPSDVLPTPGGPTKQRIGLSCFC